MRATCNLTAVLLLAAAVPPANAQTYRFSSCASNVTLTVSLVSRLTPEGLGFNSLGGTGHSTALLYQMNLSMTVGASTQAYSGIGAFGILYTSSAPSKTTLQISTTTAPGAPEWGVFLSGPGDLIPNGLPPQALPPLSAWSLANANYIFNSGGVNGTGFPIDTLGACAGSDVDALLKFLGDAANAAGGCNCGDPINLATGNLFERIADYRTAGANILSFTRYYNSMSGSNTLATALGTNWRSTYDRYLRIISGTSVRAERQDGRQLSFTLAGGVWTADSDVDLKLTSSGANWTLTGADDTVETFRTANAGQALLQTIRARNGYTQTLEYSTGNQLAAVTDSFNRKLGFTYNNGLLQTVATPDGLTLTFGYSSSGAGNRLTSAAYSTSPPTSQRYLYENSALPAALTGVIDENGDRYNTWAYDAKGRALSSQQGSGAGLTSIVYNDTDGSRTVTSALGAQEVFRFTTLQKVQKVLQIDRPASGATPAATRRFTYDSNGYLASQTGWNGVLTTYINDSRGRPLSVFEGVGTPQARTTTIAYHPAWRLPARIETPGVTTTFTYDASGQLLTRTLTDTTTGAVPYTTAGQTRIWTYTWSNFTLASVKTPRTDVAGLTKFTYDASGALTAVTNALHQVTQITRHLPGGLPQAVVDPNGVSMSLTYDPRLRLSASAVSVEGVALTQAFNYDAAGNLTGVSLPDGSAVTLGYDAARRLIGLTDLNNQSIVHKLDALANRIETRVLDADGNLRGIHSRGFDIFGRLLRDIGAAGQATVFTYDANGNLVAVTDPLNGVARQAFDPLNRRVRLTDPAGGVTASTYDAHDRLTSVTDPNGAVTTYVYNGFGEIVQRASPDSGTAVYRYDPNGNLIQSVDASGAVANYTYDALDRPLTVSHPAAAAQNVAYTYDEPGSFGIGRLTSVADAAGVLKLFYDERGSVRSETRANGTVSLLTAYTYDAAARIATVKYPSGWTVSYSRDAMGRVSAVTAQAPDGSASLPILANAGYQPFGPMNALTSGNGIAETRGFDLDYRATSLTDTGAGVVQDLAYSYDPSGNVSSIADRVTPAKSQSFGYDALNRLVAATGAYGAYAYTYDSVGNRLTRIHDGSETTGYAYAERSNRLVSVNASAAAQNSATQNIAYTMTGHVGAVTSSEGAPTRFEYNPGGRLAAVMVGADTIARYTDDAFGNRLVKAGVNTAATLFQYDRNGRLLEECDGQGIPQADYVYLDGRPIATIAPIAGKVYFLHTDHLGAPQAATDSAQNVVWTADYEPFGVTSAIPGLIAQNLRLPGQEFDVDTGLHHNGFRDYVPGWGRYLQSDPIGLAGGLNTYGYAGGNPVRFTDPTGLVFVVDSLIGGVLAGYIDIAAQLAESGVSGQPFCFDRVRNDIAFSAGFASSGLSAVGGLWATVTGIEETVRLYGSVVFAGFTNVVQTAVLNYVENKNTSLTLAAIVGTGFGALGSLAGLGIASFNEIDSILAARSTGISLGEANYLSQIVDSTGQFALQAASWGARIGATVGQTITSDLSAFFDTLKTALNK